MGAAVTVFHRLVQPADSGHVQAEESRCAEAEAGLARVRTCLAAALDELRLTKRCLSESESALAREREVNAHNTATLAALIKALNAANVRCAQMQGQLRRLGDDEQGAYVLARLEDGTVVGPFSRS